MEEELLTTPEAETEDTVEITDGEPEVSEAPQQAESLTLAVEDYNMIAVKSIPIGALSGAIFMRILGLFTYLKKFKERWFFTMKFMNLKKKIAPVLMGGALAVATAVPVFAADAGTSTGLSSVETALTTSFTSIGSSMTSIVGKILPVALPIMGALLLVGFGIKAFKKVANKA